MGNKEEENCQKDKKKAKNRIESKLKRKSSSRRRSRSVVNKVVVERPANLITLIFVTSTTIKLVARALFSVCRGRKEKTQALANLRSWFNDGKQKMKENPMHCLKLFLIGWFTCALILTMTSALGFDATPSLIMPNALAEQLKPAVPRFFFKTTIKLEEPAAASTTTDDDAGIIPEQGNTAKRKVKRSEEIKFACEEVECLEKCSRKVSKKCLASELCLKARIKYCTKKCRKKRCENRCKLDPQVGYVEREMKLDKCKEDCGDNNKCKDKCEKSFQTCKSRCGERKKKFVCDRPADLPQITGKDSPPAVVVEDEPKLETTSILTQDDEEI